MPNGRYTAGASNNTGLGQWGNELLVGTTVYLNQAKQFHAATVASFDFQSKKEDSETKVGNTMYLEGGVGADFLKGGLTVGLDYYASFKLTDDQFDGTIPGIPHPGEGQGLRARPRGSAGARKEGCPVRIPESELSVGGLRPDEHAGW